MKRSSSFVLTCALAATLPVGLLPAAESSASASGCSSNVCIYINGSGTTVNYITSTVTPNGTITTSGAVGIANSSGTILVDHGLGSHRLVSGHTYSYTWNKPNFSFKKGDIVCTLWPDIPGIPCETIG